MADEVESKLQEPWLTEKVVSFTGDGGTGMNRDRFIARLAAARPHLRLHFVSVYVRDQERSLRFFVDLLGFNLVRDVRFASGNRWVEVGPPDGAATIALVDARPTKLPSKKATCSRSTPTASLSPSTMQRKSLANND